MKFLVTGATGFIGRFLCKQLLASGCAVYGTLLEPESPSLLEDGVKPIIIQPLGADTSLSYALQGIDAVVHLAASVHIMGNQTNNALAEFQKVNVAGTARLARDASCAGVKRFVFVSSIKVNGECAVTPYSECSTPMPLDPYGISKYEAEQLLRKIEAETGLDVVIVRPPLVYGPGVKANFFNMIKTISTGIPLPFASIQNARSLIYVGNLVDALVLSATHPAAAGQTYLVSDGEDVSTSELIQRMAKVLGVSERLFPLPLMFLRLSGLLIGKGSAVNRLISSLCVDITKIRRELGWTPPFTMDEGLQATAEWYLKASKG